jgi:hypothetical protein
MSTIASVAAAHTIEPSTIKPMPMAKIRTRPYKSPSVPPVSNSVA